MRIKESVNQYERWFYIWCGFITSACWINSGESTEAYFSAFIRESERRTQEIIEGIDKANRERDARENAKIEALQTTEREIQEIRERQDKLIDNQQMLIDY